MEELLKEKQIKLKKRYTDLRSEIYLCQQKMIEVEEECKDWSMKLDCTETMIGHLQLMIKSQHLNSHCQNVCMQLREAPEIMKNQNDHLNEFINYSQNDSNDQNKVINSCDNNYNNLNHFLNDFQSNDFNLNHFMNDAENNSQKIMHNYDSQNKNCKRKKIINGSEATAQNAINWIAAMLIYYFQSEIINCEKVQRSKILSQLEVPTFANNSRYYSKIIGLLKYIKTDSNTQKEFVTFTTDQYHKYNYCGSWKDLLILLINDQNYFQSFARYQHKGYIPWNVCKKGFSIDDWDKRLLSKSIWLYLNNRYNLKLKMDFIDNLY